ncbi:MAG: zf-HC2 domain-containing protein [Planctomycetota bacterium]
MNDNHLPESCASIRPLLFAATEGELERDERLAVHAHLAICDSCRSWERGERALTALLTESAGAPAEAEPRTGPLLRWAALAAAAIVSFVLILPSATARGSIVERRMGADRAWEVASEQSFEDEHVVDVPAAAAASVRLAGGVELEAIGPVRFTVVSAGGTWRIAVERGTVVASLAEGSTLQIDSGASVGSGTWTLTPDAVSRRHEAARAEEDRSERRKEPSLAQTLTAGVQSFGRATPTIYGGSAESQRPHLLEAERLLRQVVEAEDATPYERRRALFYLAASLGRQGRDAESYEVEKQYIMEFPDGDEAPLVRHYMACHLLRVGRRDEARAMFERVVEDEGESSVGSAAAGYLESMKPGGGNSAEAIRRRAADERARSSSSASSPASSSAASDAASDAGACATERAPAPALGDEQGGYLVVRVGLDPEIADHAGYLAAATAAADFHGGSTLDWDGRDFGALESELRRQLPENALFVLPPDRLDLVLHRRIVLLGARLDDDWFMDLSFGYLTAEDDAACLRLWRRIEDVHARGTLGGTWWQASVATMDRSFCYESAAPPLAVAAGFQGPHYYYGTSDPRSGGYAEQSLETLRDAAVVEITGCGDPQGIWLFDDHRNIERDKHWDYDPDRVGEDPEGEMPRLMASQFREVELDGPILWSGTCHSGAVRRVYVEGDIVSTFGRTENATVHLLEPESSLALSWLEAGAAGLLVPLGANHGMSVSMEVDFALRHGASLGETLKSTYDDVLFAAGGELVLDLPVEGDPHPRGEQVMQGGRSNRILIGDPALRPFRPIGDAVEGAAERVSVARTDGGLRVTVVRANGWQPRSWDMFGTDRGRSYRVLTRVDLTELGLADATALSTTVRATTPGGAPMGYAMQRCAIEEHQGRRYLHLQAAGARDELDRKATTVEFTVEVGG